MVMLWQRLPHQFGYCFLKNDNGHKSVPSERSFGKNEASGSRQHRWNLDHPADA